MTDHLEDPGVDSRILDMSEVKISNLGNFRHPRLAKAHEDVIKIIEDRQVVAGFGSAL